MNRFPEYDHNYIYPDTDATHFDDLPDEVQADLYNWYNCMDLDDADKERLLELYQDGRFQAWTCPHCGDVRVYRGEPDDWGNFQGVCNQNFSYFGDRDKYTEEYINAMCDHCRCHG